MSTNNSCNDAGAINVRKRKTQLQALLDQSDNLLPARTKRQRTPFPVYSGTRTTEVPPSILEKPNEDDDQNILVSRHGLETFLSRHFVCRYCRKAINCSDLNFEQLGIATTIQFRCHRKTSRGSDCPNRNACLRPGRANVSNDPIAKNDRNIDFLLNNSLLLASQLADIGQRKTTKFLAILGLTKSPNILGDTWNKIKEHIFLVYREICDEVIDVDNLDQGIQATGEKDIGYSRALKVRERIRQKMQKANLDKNPRRACEKIRQEIQKENCDKNSRRAYCSKVDMSRATTPQDNTTACEYCGMNDHKTWVAKSCRRHQEWKDSKTGKLENPTKTTFTPPTTDILGKDVNPSTSLQIREFSESPKEPDVACMKENEMAMANIYHPEDGKGGP